MPVDPPAHEAKRQRYTSSTSQRQIGGNTVTTVTWTPEVKLEPPGDVHIPPAAQASHDHLQTQTP